VADADFVLLTVAGQRWICTIFPDHRGFPCGNPTPVLYETVAYPKIPAAALSRELSVLRMPHVVLQAQPQMFAQEGTGDDAVVRRMCGGILAAVVDRREIVGGQALPELLDELRRVTLCPW